MKQAILNNWNLVRILRLVMGIAILVQSIMTRDALFAAAGLLLTAMPLFNIGCCSTGNCVVTRPNEEPVSKEIVYEEVV